MRVHNLLRCLPFVPNLGPCLSLKFFNTLICNIKRVKMIDLEKLLCSTHSEDVELDSQQSNTRRLNIVRHPQCNTRRGKQD